MTRPKVIIVSVWAVTIVLLLVALTACGGHTHHHTTHTVHHTTVHHTVVHHTVVHHVSKPSKRKR